MPAAERAPILPEGEPLVLNEWEQGLMFLFALVAGLIGLLLLISSVEHRFHDAARPVAGLAWIGVAIIFFQAGRAGLVVEEDGVTLRGIIRRRHWAWPELEGFELRFATFLPPLQVNLYGDRNIRVRGFRGRTANDRELADRRVAELNRRVENATRRG